ncbi:amidohydrolase/peptidase M20 [Gluconobacter thailandicus F149-1 = NBRC 100600]|uniref:Amidohydrolase n=1 Tax=Gluconobacter thailandicus NBRC 3257 TaxID=1381097 RepID=A0ABQ0J1B1_GLUTH|nr:amidohydrolase [Gluconobacter thailandicus]KXV53516.1 amidohydrolase [Gluconobacter thailandicus]GAC88410.1 amidohydrolase [Gluconobacter thailandicus NBRC 3255]GAD27588.1 amidohydrolase [Gluconobacter thailandicus NBRC 3257]GAN91934.1 amidohydrolase/peptidase M20 [Gluconobacter thailandicus F149-1 = NBRC 100600]GEL87764.1 hydrolase [Gluconobacter thailandicus F149-1 = NBRC 100600]
MDLADLVALRKDLHAHPELRFEELRTSDIVAEVLTSLGYRPSRGLAKTGVVASLQGKKPGPSIILRADMDALPIEERGDHAHISRHPGRMHACGHDGHTTMLLGAAAALALDPPECGTVHFVFQPGEEGGAGAKVMLEEGLLEQFPAGRVFGMHNWPGLPIGSMATRKGAIMAGGWRFLVEIKGQGSHAAQPHLGRDALTIGAAFVQEAQLLVSRRSNPLTTAVLSICTFHAGTTDNILPETATLRGTIRSLDVQELEALKKGMTRLAAGLALAHDVAITVQFHQPYPVTVNTADETELALAAMKQVIGTQGTVVSDMTPSMASEDFGFMLEKRPGALVMLGNGASAPLHAPDYDFDDTIIPQGIAYWVALAHTCLRINQDI